MKSGQLGSPRDTHGRTFDPVSAASSRPGSGQGAFGEPVGPFALDDPADSLAFGAFDIGKGPAEQRIAKLRQLLDQGVLTESEYQAQRQQIISGI